MAKDYSVIISSIGRKEYLIDLLGSIYGQTQLPFEVLLLLDDNQHCRKISVDLAIYNHIQIVFCERYGLAEKRNLGAKLARTENIIYTDDDDIWNAAKAEYVVKALEESDIVCHGYSKFGEEFREAVLPLGHRSRYIGPAHIMSGTNKFGGGSSISAKKWVICAVRFNKEYAFCEDLEWWFRVLLSGCSVYYIAENLVSYRTHGQNMTSAVYLIEGYRIRLAFEQAKRSTYMIVSSTAIVIKASIKSFLTAAHGKAANKFNSHHKKQELYRAPSNFTTPTND